MLIAFAGNRPDEPGRSPHRFPPANSGWVAERVRRLLAELRPTAVVGAAAAGADLIVLEAAATLGIESHVVLPFPVAAFRARSVADRGAAWTERFDRLLDGLPAQRLTVGADDPGSEGVYERANTATLDVASALAGDDVVVVLVIRPKGNERDEGVSDDFAARAEARDLLVLELDPRLRQSEMRTAFVVMPYGVKVDRAGAQIDCEATFAKVVVPALESADLDWTRADRQIDAGIIHIGMLDRLASSDVVVVDTATDNANAFYELGARHVLRPRSTVLIGPLSGRLPFNVEMLRRVGYRLTGAAVSDVDGVDAVRRLRPFLTATRDGRAADSPLYQLFDVRPPTITARAGGGSPAVELHRRIDASADEAPALQALAEDVAAAPIPPNLRCELLLRVATRLRAIGAYEEAVALLSTITITEERPLLYGWWCQQLALAERRLGEQLLAAGGDPDRLWDSAERRLASAMARLGDDPETCGIAGGLAKRRALRLLRRDRRPATAIHAGALLDRALDLYRRGFQRQPSDFYTGVNVVTVGRLRARQGAPPNTVDLDQIAAVTAFYAGRALTDDFWAAATMAELALDAHLGGESRITPDAVVAAFWRALAIPHAVDHRTALTDQLDLLRLASGDPHGTVHAVLEALAFRP